MFDFQMILTVAVFILTVTFLVWRPNELNESIPPAIGAIIVFVTGVVSLSDLSTIFGVVSGASITIISTIVMSIVLESIGFFRYVAYNLVKRANGSGVALFWYVNLLCFLMTMFFNNDGSILITTPIIIQIMSILNLKYHEKIPFLLSGALIATASSAPIGVSNLANLIALKIVGLDLNTYALLMFVPSITGLLFIAWMLYLFFRKDIPKKIPVLQQMLDYHHAVPRGFYSLSTIERWVGHSLKQKIAVFHPLGDQDPISVDWPLFHRCLAVVILTRLGFYIGAPLGIPTEWIAMVGALLLILFRWYRTRSGIMDIVKKTPWHIILFAFSLYIIVYALKNVGLTDMLVHILQSTIVTSHFQAIFTMGMLLTVMSNFLNNLPSVMVGTLALTQMNLDLSTIQISYLANIIGSDIGSLISPMGTLATLIWMFLLRTSGIPFTWKQYLRVSIFVIPPGLLISLLFLYLWTNLFI